MNLQLHDSKFQIKGVLTLMIALTEVQKTDYGSW